MFAKRVDITIERVGRDRKAALGMNGLDRFERGPMRRHGLLDKQRQKMALLGAHLFAHDHFDPVVVGEFAGLNGSGDGIVVGYRDQAQIGMVGHKVKHFCRAGRSIARQGVDMQVGF